MNIHKYEHSHRHRQESQTGFHRAFISPNEKILFEMTMMSRITGELKAYNGFQFPFEEGKKKKKQQKELELGRMNKILWGSTKGLLVKSLKIQKANVDLSAIVLAARLRHLTPFLLNKL